MRVNGLNIEPPAEWQNHSESFMDFHYLSW